MQRSYRRQRRAYLYECIWPRGNLLEQKEFARCDPEFFPSTLVGELVLLGDRGIQRATPHWRLHRESRKIPQPRGTLGRLADLIFLTEVLEILATRCAGLGDSRPTLWTKSLVKKVRFFKRDDMRMGCQHALHQRGARTWTPTMNTRCGVVSDEAIAL